jgi:hypothetical protein
MERPATNARALNDFQWRAHPGIVIDSGRPQGNEAHPHSSLGRLTPAELARSSNPAEQRPLRDLDAPHCCLLQLPSSKDIRRAQVLRKIKDRSGKQENYSKMLN